MIHTHTSLTRVVAAIALAGVVEDLERAVRVFAVKNAWREEFARRRRRPRRWQKGRAWGFAIFAILDRWSARARVAAANVENQKIAIRSDMNGWVV